jgi:hypothetical protein
MYSSLAVWALSTMEPVYELKKEKQKITVEHLTNDFLVYKIDKDGEDQDEEWNIMTFTDNFGV